MWLGACRALEAFGADATDALGSHAVAARQGVKCGEVGIGDLPRPPELVVCGGGTGESGRVDDIGKLALQHVADSIATTDSPLLAFLLGLRLAWGLVTGWVIMVCLGVTFEPELMLLSRLWDKMGLRMSGAMGASLGPPLGRQRRTPWLSR